MGTRRAVPSRTTGPGRTSRGDCWRRSYASGRPAEATATLPAFAPLSSSSGSNRRRSRAAAPLSEAVTVAARKIWGARAPPPGRCLTQQRRRRGAAGRGPPPGGRLPRRGSCALTLSRRLCALGCLLFPGKGPRASAPCRRSTGGKWCRRQPRGSRSAQWWGEPWSRAGRAAAFWWKGATSLPVSQCPLPPSLVLLRLRAKEGKNI
mmetsp:Transcript_27933/g.79004  ORF Transcript_27933/g.79004 Transcript_27933/m.79004 type:complete len:206 (+) Transcript_27933:626-1243(+)